MKTLLVYYSRTGTTKKLAEILAKKIGAETEEIKDTVNRKGLFGYLLAGRDGMKRQLTKIEQPKLNPADFDLVIIGTPTWAGNLSAPARTYLTEYKNRFNKAAFFCTRGGKCNEIMFKEMEEITGKKPLATLSLKAKEVATDGSNEADEFCAEITGAV